MPTTRKTTSEKPSSTEKKPTSAAKKPAEEKQAPQQQVMQTAGSAPDASRMSKRNVSSEEIARRAHELWQQRGGGHGNDHEDWLRAERELSSKDS